MKLTPILVGAFTLALATSASAQTLTIATVNNGDMVRMQALSPAFTEETGIQLNWVVLEENTLRQNVTTDIATNGGQYDVMTIGTYEAPIWAKQGWLKPLDTLAADPEYDVDDLLPPIRDALSYEGKLYAAPFWGRRLSAPAV
jgi:sorbitol/mannitol transport system substrate-binding protein